MNYEKFEMLDDQNACALLIDHQAGLMLFCGDIDPIHLRNNCIALAKVLKLHNIPVVMSAAAFGPAGPLGPFLPEILELFPDVQPIYRTKINSMHDPRIREAIEVTGRKKVIAAGITADFCVGIPAKTLAAEGYDVRLVMDASGNYSNQVLAASTANLTQYGVKVTNWLSVACELQQDWAIEKTAQGLLEIYREHLPEWSMLQLTSDTWKSLQK
ncbi:MULTISPECIES: isochorismatase family protein [unclassified Microcoleus]|uniref:isochorismatase family protein n=1 Tax=unclassified Microcoleus TaxID=2642155 RepID=UPI001E0F65BB|nr:MULTISPECIES: isochorismatase family protein [unclassified Microcoleus]MCC3445397.1 isochorismatase family protein [Microcoleus sp. PH2017_03_ELD_O_A]MCC3469840.1 isochorismatase family protein [Microcoleus sp. PH2017_06_SFM_O_A]TAE06563.1 MAG: isochorismatase family protein [Oscillatoriales cyanobacterium]MCC3415954.1 isochorismatase family protein [Microcoleus sp. PH2017_02_FOX_O_A]MCC3449678.1 isochorismatase family protein [Microcoleus sp. PH2017_09_SFU_O_A]